MKLHAVNRQGAMTESHDYPVSLGAGAHLELLRQSFVGDDERVVPGRLERRIEAGEHAASIVFDGRRLAVHRNGRSYDRSAEYGADRLVTQTDSENGHLTPELTNH